MVLVVLAAALAGVLPAAVPAGARHLAPSADSGLQLEGVSAESASDVWAVGVTSGSDQQPEIVHWNGTGLSRVPTNLAPAGQIIPGELHAVSADSPADAWAVGWVSPPRTHMVQSLVLRWDGSRWARVTSPNQSPVANDLKLVKAIGPSDVWAAGDYLDTRTHTRRSVVIHWDGTKWSTIQFPAAVAKQLAISGFTSVDPVGPKSVFALAYHAVRVGHGSIRSDEILHWNGRSWQKTKPFFGAGLSGVSASSSGDAWAVGYFCIPNNCPPFQTLALHLSGGNWRYSPTPHPGCKGFTPRCKGDSRLVSVTAHSPSAVWAYGSCKGECRDGHTVILSRKGDSWSRVAAPGVTFSSAISPASATDAWAIGGGSLLHWDGSSWTRM